MLVMITGFSTMTAYEFIRTSKKTFKRLIDGEIIYISYTARKDNKLRFFRIQLEELPFKGEIS